MPLKQKSPPHQLIFKKMRSRRITLITFFVIGFCYAGLWYVDYFENRVTIIDGLTTQNDNRLAFEKQVHQLVRGYPIEKMLPYILEKDPIIVAFLISIAKKESNWGKHVPVLNGQDCYNYWGYRGKGRRLGSGGHTCFDTPQQAVDVVAKRIETLVYERGLNTPAKMIIWKCGSSCANHSRTGVQKWISDVRFYFFKIAKVD